MLKGYLRDHWLQVLPWVPVLLVPLLYLVFAQFADDGSEMRIDGHLSLSLLAFLLFFAVHDVLLVRGLLMRGRNIPYVLGLVTLLALFAFAGWLRMDERERFREREPQHRMPEPRPIVGKPHAAPPPLERAADARRGPSPVVLDVVIAMLLAGTDLSAVFFAKYIGQKRRNDELERERLKQELDYLKAQINPHFFMNVLNNIHGMIELSPQLAQDMVMELSSLMRYVLYEGSKPRIELATEVDFLRAYVALMSKRYSSKKLGVAFNVPENVPSGVSVPPLLFVVMVENAFKHGVSYLQKSDIEISLALSDSCIDFFCRNGKRPDSLVTKEGGIGLANLRKRLSLIYGSRFSLDVDDAAETYTVKMSIPYDF